MAETSTSPGYYGTEIYSYINELDPTFKDDVSPQEFLERLQDEEYAGKIYAYLADSDETFVEDLSLDEFVSNVKKKEEPAVTESVSDAGSSEPRPFTAELDSLYPGLNEVLEEQYGPRDPFAQPDSSQAEMEYLDLRRGLFLAGKETEKVSEEQAALQVEEMERLEEERKIAAASMPAVPALEGREAPDYVAQLREVYGPYGVRFETSTALGLGEFGSIKAYAVGADGNAVEYNIDIVDGKVVEGQLDGLNEFLQSNAKAKGGVDVDKRSLSEKALRVQQMRPVARRNEDGSQSTVLMASAEADGRHFAYPTLFPTGDGFSADPKNWIELDPDAAFDEAQRRGELFEFNTAEEANRFAEGEWKEIRETDAIAERMWAEKGRNYYADEMFLRKVEEKKREYEFLESLTPGRDKVVGRFGDKKLDEIEIPPEFQKYLVTYTDDRGEKKLVARTDIEEVRQQKERELAALEQQFDNDNELLRLKEDYDELLGKRRGEIMERAAALNQEGKAIQNRADVASINRFGVPVKGLMDMQPQTEGEYNEMIGLLTQYNTGIDQRRTAALQYEKNKLYYDAQHEKLINQEYVDGWEEFTSAWNWDRGEAIARLVLINWGYYDVIGDEKAEEEAMREVSARINSGETGTVGRATSRTNLTGTTESFLERINPLYGGMDAITYAAALTNESLSQLLPIWYRILPVAAAGGAVYGAAGGPVGSTFGALTSTFGASIAGATAAVTTVGMPVSELVLELGASILETGTNKGYDWADPNSALLALNDESLWEEGAKRGYQRGVPIALTGMVSNMMMAKAALGGSRVLPLAERMAIAVGTGVTVDPASEMLGEYLALVNSGEYTGSVANVKEIAAEGLGAIGMGFGFTTAMAAYGYAKDVVTDANFDLALRLMTPEGIAKENVRGERIVSWANRMERLGKIDAEQAEAIRKNVGRRRQANELLGRRIDSRPGSDSQVIGRIVELLEAKEELERSGPSVFSEKIRAITEEIALIAESGKVEKPGGAAVNLSDIRGRIRNRRPGVYKFNGKKVTRDDFMAKIQEATPRQLKRARAYNDIEAQRELINRRDAIQKREAAEVPVGEQPRVSPQVDEQVREATQEDLQAEEQGSLDLDRKAVILESIAEKLNDEVELNEVEQAFLEDNKDDIEADQKRLEALDQAAAKVEVRGEPEVQGRVPLKRLKRLAANAKKALAKNFPDANIIIHNDKASYKQAAQENGLTGEGSAGFIGTDNKTIHIFAPLASETTIAHETFHAILRNTIDSAQTQELMGEFVTTLKKVIPPDNPLAAKLDKYQQLYDAGQMNEEYVAEFFGELAAAYPKLDRKGKSVIARFVERLGKLLGVDLTLSPDLTKRDQQILSLLERLAGQVSLGETITARETEALRSLTTDRQQTEDKLGAAEQKVDDFSDEQMESMAKQGVAFHFSDVDITKVLPEKLKRTIYGYGFYTTSEGRSDSVFRTYGDRVTLIDTNQLNLLDGDTRITEEQAKKLRDFAKMELEELDETGELVYFPEKAIVLQSLAELKAGAAWANVLIEGSAEAVFGDVKMVPREIANRSTTPDVITYDIPQQAQVAALIQEAFGFDGADFGRAVNMDETRYGIISAIWNFDKLNRAIIEPGQEPTRAAEQRAQRMDDGPPRFNEDGLPEVRAAEQRLLEEATPEWMADAFKDSDPVLRDFFVALAEQPGVRMFLNSIGGGFVYANENKGSTEVDVRTSIYMEGGAVYLDLLEVFEDKGRGAGTRFMQDFVAALDATNAESKLMAWPPKWYQQDMSEEEMQAISNRLKGFYGRFGFTPIPNSDSMTRQPGAAPVEVSQATRRVDARRAELLEEIADKRTKQQLLGNVIAQTYEVYEDKAAREKLRYIEDLVDPYDDAISPDELMGRALTPEQIEAINDEYGDGLINEDGFAESFEDFVDSDIVIDYHDLVVEARENIGRLRRVEQQAQESERQTRAEESTREQKFGELEDKEMALEHILAVNKAEYGRTETDVYNQYEAYLEGRLDEADKEYLRSLALGIDVETGRVDNANNLYDVFLEFQDVRDQRNELESGAAEQRIDIDEVRMRSRAGSRISKGLATYKVKGERQVEEIENLTRDYVREQAPKAYIKNANVLAKYPLVRGVREFGEITTVEQADELYDIYTQQTMDNLRWMMETYPDEFSEISTLWYDGANKIANELATEFGVTPEQAAGILAALSPQKDWYQNAHLARLLLEAFAENPVMTRKMVNYQRKFTKGKIAEKKKDLKKARAAKGKSRAKAKVDKFNKDKARLLDDIAEAEAILESIAALEGTRMLDADPSMMGYFVRLHAETTKPISYQVISPDGEMVGPAKKDDGTTAKWAWGSYNEIGKGVSIRLNGSQENITISLGQQHKVRNFFNNIIDPMSAEGDVTMDTHAIAVSLLKPLSTKSAEVNHNFGGVGSSSSGAKGISGTYYANQEAYQMLAEEMGLLPRQVQSVTWEAVRGLFTDKFKANKENVNAINQIWENYADGKITIDEARAQVLERAGGINPPVWAESVQGESREGVREGRERGAGRTGGRAAEQRVAENEAENTKLPSTLKEAQAQGLLMHGANAAFAAFSPAYIRGGSRARLGYGFYFTDDATKAGDYGSYDVYVDKSNLNMFELSEEDGTKIDVEGLLRMAAEEMVKDEPRSRADDLKFFEERYLKQFYDAVNDAEENSDTPMQTSMELIRMYNRRQISLMTLGAAVLDIAQLDVTNSERAIRIAKGYLPPDGGGVRALSVLFMSAGFDGYYVGGAMTPMREAVVFNIPKLNESIVNAVPRKSGAEQRISEPLHDAAVRYNVNEKGFMPNDAPTENIIQFGKMLAKEGFGLGRASNGSRYVTRNGRLFRIFEAYRKQRSEDIQDRIEYEAEQRARELEERIIEIYNADERPYTGKDFEGRAAEQKVVVEAMAEPGTIADLVARGRELGLRDASIRSVLLKRFGKDNADAIDTALTEYFDMFRAIPEAFGNVEGGIEVGRQIYDDVRRQLDEFARPKKPGRMTKRERTDRIEELRAKFPEQKKLSDTELLRKHPRQAVAPAIADVRAEALNLLRNNRLFNEQTTEVQEQLLVAFDKTLQTKANKQVNTLISQIRNNIRQRRKGVSNANRVRNELKKVLTELLPAGKYTKAEAKAITTLVNNVTEDNMLVQIEKLMDLVDKKAKADINAELQDIMKLDRRIRSERKYAEREVREVQKNLRNLIRKVLPLANYTKTDVNRLNKLVNEVNENNYDDKAEEVLKIVDKKREAIRQSLLKDIENIVKKAAKTRRTPTGKVRARSLDAPGQAFFRTALRVLRAVRDDDATQIENIKASLSHNPEVDEVAQKYLNGESLTSREQQLMDQKSALDIFYELNGKSIEELEAIIEDLKITAAFSRANLKATRAARAERMATLREGAKESVTRDWGDLAVNEDGTAKSQNQINAELRKQKSLGEALKTRGMRAKYDALVGWAQEGKRMTPAKIAKKAWSHYGSLTGIMGEFFRENLYKRLGKMEEDYLRGKFKERENLDAMANSIEGITNGFVEIGEIIFTNGDLTVKYGNTSRKFTTDELLRIYALSLNPVQKQRLMLMGFTDEVMADITEFLDDRLIEFADKTVAYLSTDYYEGVNDVHVKVNDVNLPYVENYFPTKTQLEEFFRLDDEQAMRSTFFGPNAQLASPLKDRVAQTSEISLKMDLGFHGELTSHINSMERFKAFAEGTQEMNAVLSDSYTTALANLIGAEKAIVMLAAQGVSPERFMSEMSFPLVDKLVSRYTGVSLGYKLMQIPKQASSMFAGVQDYQYGDKKNPIIDRIMWSVDMMRILPGAILEGVSLAKYKGPIQQMMEESATLRSRMEDTLEGDLYGLATGASGTATKLSKKDFQKAQKALKGVRKGGATVTAFGDALGILGYVPAYQRNRQRGMSKREAIDKFNEYNETQQSRRPGERAPIQIYRDGHKRLFTAFTSSQLLYLNNMLRLTAQINRSVRQGGWRSVSASDLRGLYFNAFGAAFTFAIASNIMLILFGSDEEKEKAWWDSLFSPVKNFFIYPILGSTAESIYNKLMGNQYPKKIALDPLDRVERSMTKAFKDGEFGPLIKNSTEMLIGTNLDPAISLIEVAGGEPLEDEIYDVIGVPKSARPE